ncbi:MAG: hypothetical protein D8M59_05050 [Planctomycetes bacterium]|nr:hypothetical protein [Planctomycetota bacterium]NOG56053.1 hypothetical protein [Planctomycetota bacterium]
MIDEYPSDEDIERFSREDDEDSEWLLRGECRCQECGRVLYDDADVCPSCGAYQLDLPGSRSPTGHVGLFGKYPWLWAWGAILALLGFTKAIGLW